MCAIKKDVSFTPNVICWTIAFIILVIIFFVQRL